MRAVSVAVDILVDVVGKGRAEDIVCGEISDGHLAAIVAAAIRKGQYDLRVIN